ncbi:hypothetical protein HYDPIDRAFT_137903 [Hydnomerulius pinastri MD-312]|uniref:Zn(2)-C6 fungal-type domain-containing protein n=1 Tax=Hydnomerulius pinastri MD-312 TaxID=994086 RepID=A0A0C9WBM3_9AGAM|nr:hypothetical protein HYDPIDRAFT_137903 [Hydnomerulius pinastri MD-312]
MSTELKAIRKKRTASEATSSNPAPEGDHRKRRRNRTTQSCLNCHTSKRMCDRKRPCGRCTQLGLTGLCVYEVDDPSQRTDVQDESSRLRKRVAELEGVIRELKNKPHPRWVQSGSSPGEEFEKWHARAQSRPASDDSSNESRDQSGPSSPRSTDARVDSNEESSGKQHTELHHQSLQQGYPPPSFPPSSLDPSGPNSAQTYSPYFSVSSPLSTPSSAIMTPTDEYSRTHIMIAGEQQLSRDLDLASIFMSYPGLMGCDEGMGHVDRALRTDALNEHHDDPCLAKHNHGRTIDGHCGCLNEVASYNVVLELSLRLRKAADVLNRSASHRFNSGCMLNQRIAELDNLAINTLGNMTTSPNDLGQMPLRSRANTAPSIVASNFTTNGCVPTVSVPTVSPQSLQGLRSWDIMSSVSDSSSTCDDSFMSWEPSRRG